MSLRPLTSDLWRRWLPLAVFSVLWLDLIRLLSTQWEAREQYAYGWFVPFFAAALLWRRWLDRPGENRESRKQKAEIAKDHRALTADLRPLTSGSCDSSLSAGGEGRGEVVPLPAFKFQLSAFPISAFVLPAFIFLLCLSLLPLRVIYEINTDWPLISWLYTLIVVALTLYAFHLAGPPSSPREMASWPVESVRYSTGSPISPGPSSPVVPTSAFRFQVSSLDSPSPLGSATLPSPSALSWSPSSGPTASKKG